MPTPGHRDGLPEQLIHTIGDGWPAYAWSFPIGDGRANIGFGMLRANLQGRGRTGLTEPLARLLPDQPAEPGTDRAAHLPLSTWRPRQPEGRVLLAGDAASLINPLTGEGIYYAILSGRLAGQDAFAGDPAMSAPPTGPHSAASSAGTSRPRPCWPACPGTRTTSIRRSRSPAGTRRRSTPSLTSDWAADCSPFLSPAGCCCAWSNGSRATG